MVQSSDDAIRVLHVDDDPEFADLTATFLERERDRFSVVTATSADEGLSVLAESDVDCVVSDYEMPGKDGVDFLRAVRGAYPDLPFLLFTGKGSEEVASEAISAGVTDYLQKETGTDQYAVLANRIENAVEHARARRQRQRHLDAIETAQEGISILDEHGRFIYVNDAYASLYGYDPDELLGHHWELLYPDSEAEFVRNDVLPTVEENGVWQGKTTGLRADGTTFREDHVLSTTANGELVCAVRDITQRKERERKLREEQTFIDQALDTLNDIFYVVGTDGSLERWNDRLTEVTGYTDEEVADMQAVELFPEGEQERITDAIEETLANGEATVEAHLHTADGDRVPYEFTGARLTDPNGDLLGLVGFGRDITERKERETELQRTAARLEALFEHSPDMINVHDADGNLLDPNPRLCEKTGYDEAELTDMKVWELDRAIDPDDAYAIWEGMEIGDRQKLEGTYQRRDGSRFPVEVHIQRLDLEGADRFIAISRDISERKERERMLQQERDRFRAVFKEAFDAMVIADDDGRYVSVNESAAELFGLPKDELLGRSIAEFAPEDFDFETAWEEFQRSDKQRDTFPLVQSDGTRRHVEYAATPDIIPGRHLSVLRDVTERKERELALERTQEQLEFILEETDSLIWSIDLETDEVTSLDGPADRFFGFSEQAQLPDVETFFENGVHPDDRATMKRTHEKLKQGETDRIEIEYRTPPEQGDVRWLHVNGYLRTDDDRQLTGITTDVTDLKRQNERLEEFASIVSHDLRNPLNVAQGRVELAQEECESEHLEQVVTAHDRMERLIKDLLILAREGGSIGETEVVDLPETVQQGWQTVSTTGATLVVETDQTVRADPSRLRQLLENLMRNAVDHGGEDVTITVGRCADGTGFYVADDGPGIPADDRERVFESGYSTADEGTGFGLAIVDEIVEAHGWEIEVADSDDGGARFEITGIEEGPE